MPSVKKAAVAAPKASKGKAKTPASATVETTKKSVSPLRAQIVTFMRKGKVYTTREIVEGLNRAPGNAGGAPVVTQLKKLVSEGIVIQADGERGYTWTKK